MNLAHDERGVTGVMRTGGQLLFGAGMSAEIGRVVAEFGTRALICVDPAISALAVFASILADVERAGVVFTVFSAIIPELPASTVAEALDVASGFQPDVVVAIGGGSCIDLAKVTSLLLTHGGELADDDGELRVPGPVRPIVAVPTTRGPARR